MSNSDRTLNYPLIKASEIEAMEEISRPHPLNNKALRHTKSLGDKVGMKNIGFHLVRVEPGKETTQFHFHCQEEEFIYILSGKGTLELGDEVIEVGPGDFMGFTAPSLPHAMKNESDDDLVYLMGGDRKQFDVVEYPKLAKRMYKHSGERQMVRISDAEPLSF